MSLEVPFKIQISSPSDSLSLLFKAWKKPASEESERLDRLEYKSIEVGRITDAAATQQTVLAIADDSGVAKYSVEGLAVVDPAKCEFYARTGASDKERLHLAIDRRCVFETVKKAYLEGQLHPIELSLAATIEDFAEAASIQCALRGFRVKKPTEESFTGPIFLATEEAMDQDSRVALLQEGDQLFEALSAATYKAGFVSSFEERFCRPAVARAANWCLLNFDQFGSLPDSQSPTWNWHGILLRYCYAHVHGEGAAMAMESTRPDFYEWVKWLAPLPIHHENVARFVELSRDQLMALESLSYIGSLPTERSLNYFRGTGPTLGSALTETMIKCPHFEAAVKSIGATQYFGIVGQTVSFQDWMAEVPPTVAAAIEGANISLDAEAEEKQQVRWQVWSRVRRATLFSGWREHAVFRATAMGVLLALEKREFAEAKALLGRFNVWFRQERVIARADQRAFTRLPEI